jgi:hypothetical protein
MDGIPASGGRDHLRDHHHDAAETRIQQGFFNLCALAGAQWAH